MIAEAIIIEEFEYAFNAYPFIKVKQHLRKLDRFRIRPSGSRIIVLLPGNSTSDESTLDRPRIPCLSLISPRLDEILIIRSTGFPAFVSYN